MSVLPKGSSVAANGDSARTAKPIEVTLSDEDRASTLQQMLVDLSLAGAPAQVLGTMSRFYWKLRPVDFIMSISRRGLPDGQYRITRRIDPAAIAKGETPPPPPPPPLSQASQREQDVHSGGFIGELLQRNGPTVTGHLHVINDPVLGDSIAGYRSLMALPLFHEGEPVYWTLQFRRESNAFSERDFEQSWIISNLIGGANTRLLLMNEVKQLNAQLSRQFEEVARVQRSLLPQQTPELPGLSIATSYLTSQQAGGDYYDFLRLGEGRLGIFIADVAGHGAAAATVMAMLHAILHAYEGPGTKPHEILGYANARLTRAGIDGTFATAFLGIYDAATGVFEYSRAGHNPPRLRRGRTGQVEALVDGAGLPLGVQHPFESGSESVTLMPGDTLVLYTDGITEAMKPVRSSHGQENELFGIDRLDAAIAQAGLSPCGMGAMPDKVIEKIQAAVHEHTGRLDRDDDQTLVVLQRVHTQCTLPR